MGKYNSGDIVGPYTLLELINTERKKWTTQCNTCGSINEVFQSNFTKQKMCVKCRNNNIKHPRIDLAEQRFGSLIAKKYLGNSKWLCVCECDGKEVVISTGHLMSGHTQSCGCYMKQRASEANSKIFPNDKYNLLTVKRRVEDYITPKGVHYPKYECECECGIVVDVLGSNLTNGNTKSCGCLTDCENVKIIKQTIFKAKVKYKIEYVIDDLKTDKERALRFDFALLNEDNSLYCVIEYQGEQHYYKKERKTNFGRYAREVSDPMKRDYCKRNNILLYEIKYDEDALASISTIINEYYACQYRAKRA